MGVYEVKQRIVGMREMKKLAIVRRAESDSVVEVDIYVTEQLSQTSSARIYYCLEHAKHTIIISAIKWH